MENTMSPRHQANIEAKADRGIAAIDSLITTRLITDTAFPTISDLDSGRRFMLYELDTNGVHTDGDPDLIASSAMWVAVGIEADRLAGKVRYAAGEAPTLFDTSRRSVLDKLDALVWVQTHPAPADPFAGLNGGPQHVAEPF